MGEQNLIFSENFNPSEILFRTSQIEKIDNVFKTFEGNLFLLGNTGTGKTTTIKSIMTRNRMKYLYISATGKITSLQLFRALLNTSIKDRESLIKKLVQDLIGNPRVIIFDEVEKILNLEEFFDTLNYVYRQTSTPIIIISNKHTLLLSMPEDARLTIFFQRVDFSPYDAVELKQIAEGRIKLLSSTLIIPSVSLEYICTKCVEDGSARKLLYLVKKCLFGNDFSQEFVQNMEKEMEREDWDRWYGSLGVAQKKFLKAVDYLFYKNIQGSGNGEIRTSEIPKEMGGLSPQRISSLISEFVNLGVLEERYVNKGRSGGRSRLVSFTNQDIYNRLQGVLDG